MKFLQSKPITPPAKKDWPGERTTPLYWVARGTVEIPGDPTGVEFLVAADRHYELFINGEYVLFQRGFFNGDDYIFVQRWREILLPDISKGRNVLDFVVRSDPWQNKNYRFYRPMLQVEGTIRSNEGDVSVVTDDSWQTTLLDGWREQLGLGGCQTIPVETVTLVNKEHAILSGFDERQLDWKAPGMLDGSGANPEYIEWTDAPKRMDTRKPIRLAWSGSAYLPSRALRFEKVSGSDGMAGSSVILQKEFSCKEECILAVAGPALSHTRVLLNGVIIGERNDIPSPHQMPLPEYLTPVARGKTISGNNTLRIEILDRPANATRELFFIPQVIPPLTQSMAANWSRGDGQSLSPISQPLGMAQSIGAKCTIENEGVTSSGEATSFFVEPASPGLVRSVVLDMGELTQSRFSFRLEAETAGRICMAYGFSCDEGVVDCNRMNLQAADVLNVPAGLSEYRSFEPRTFRYLDLIFEGFEGAVTVSEIQAEEAVFVDETKSEFECSDSLVNDIRRASVRTAQLCSDELYVDNPEREHAQWADPVNICPLAGYACFGEYRKARKVFEEVARAQVDDGQLPGYVPGKWFPRIPIQTHMTLFAGAFFDYFMHTGDEGFGRRILPVIEKMIDHWERYRTADGLITNLHTVFVDWGSHMYSYGLGPKEQTGPTGALTTMNADYLGVLGNTARIARYLGNDTLAERSMQLADEVRTAMRRYLFDTGLGVFRDGIGNPLAEKNISQPANVLAVLFGAAPDGQEEQILRRAWNAPEEWDVIPINALLAWKAGEALFTFGCDDLAISWLRDRFGAMVKTGSDTLWETWQDHASRCQGTGAGPAYLFNRFLAGLYPVEPGYSIIGIDPHPTNLKNLQATLTTPHGPVQIAWENTGKMLACNLILPETFQDRKIITSPIVNLSVTIAEKKRSKQRL